MTIVLELSSTKRRNTLSTASSEAMQVRFRTVDGITIRYAESDERQDTPILLTNPWPESLYAFLPIWQTLSQHSNLLAIDLPGFGQSERRNDLLSPRAMGEFLIRLIDEWGLNTPHIVAPDVGTSAALFAAALHPGKLRSLVIGSGATAYPLQVGGVLKDIIDAPDLEAFRAIDPRVTLGASLDKGHEQYRLPTEVREDYLKSYEGGRLRLGGRCRPVRDDHLGLGQGRLPEHWSVNGLPLSWCGCCSGHEIRTSSNVVKVLSGK
jgi:pimeloyl-ACP methyl ester carboxylesterase